MKNIKTIVIYIFMSILALACIYPIIFMFIAGSHPSGNVVVFPPPFWFGDYFAKNLQSLQERIPIWNALFNSLKIAIVYTTFNLLVCSMAAYSLAKFKFKGRDIVFTIMMLALMIPIYTKLVPLYRMMNTLGINNTHLAVILPDIAGVFGIFLMRQNFHAVSDSLLEAARIDGASEWKIFYKVAMPLMIPALTALGIYMFVTQWSNFTWPLIILNDVDKYTLPLALALIKGDTRIDYGQIMVGAMFSVVPIMIVFLILQKYFIAGITSGSVKE